MPRQFQHFYLISCGHCLVSTSRNSYYNVLGSFLGILSVMSKPWERAPLSVNSPVQPYNLPLLMIPPSPLTASFYIHILMWSLALTGTDEQSLTTSLVSMIFIPGEVSVFSTQATETSSLLFSEDTKRNYIEEHRYQVGLQYCLSARALCSLL